MPSEDDLKKIDKEIEGGIVNDGRQKFSTGKPRAASLTSFWTDIYADAAPADA